MKVIRVFKRIVNIVKGIDLMDIKAYQNAGLVIGENCAIMPGVRIDYNHCKHITIGNRVILAPEVYLLSHDASTKNKLGYAKIGKISIGDDVFIGLRTIIMPNVSIGTNSIIGAGSVVVNDIPSNSVAVGNPARIICDVDSYYSKEKAKMQNAPLFGEEFSERSITNKMERKEKMEKMNNRMTNGYGYIR